MVCLNKVALLLALVASTCAVFIDDAFVTDWTRHWVGRTTKYSLESESTALGLSDHSQLFQIDLSYNGTSQSVPLNWRVDLSKYGKNPQYVLLTRTKKVYTFSEESPDVYVWDLETGIFNEKYTIEKGYPVGVINYFNRGVIVVGSQGTADVFGLCKKQPHVSLGDVQPTSQVFSSIHDGKVLIVTKNEVIIVDGATHTISGKYPYKEGSVASIERNIIKTDSNQLFIIGESSLQKVKKVPSIQESELVVINEEFFLIYSRDELKFYSVISGSASVVEAEIEKISDIINVEYIYNLVTEFLVVTTPEYKLVYDISGLVTDSDPLGIQKIVSFEYYTNPQSESLVNDFIQFNLTSNSLKLISSDKVSYFSEKSDIRFATFNTPDVYGNDYRTSAILKDNFYSCSSGEFLIVNKPPSVEAEEIASHLLEDGTEGSLLQRWIVRTKRHLSELGRFVYIAVSTGKWDHFPGADLSSVDTGFEKYVIFFDENEKAIVAVDSLTGEIVWSTLTLQQEVIELFQFSEDTIAVVHEHQVLKLNLRDGTYIDGLSQNFSSKLNAVIPLEVGSRQVFGYVSGKTVTLSEPELKLEDDKYLLDENTLQAYKLDKSTLSLVPTWKFPLGQLERIISVKQASSDRDPAAIGIALSDRSVLYKYLYPNWASVFTYDESTKSLNVYIVDVVTGSVLYSQKHSEEEELDPSSISVTVNANWIVYSYFSYSPRPEQRIVSIDLFENVDPKSKQENSENLSVFENFNNTIGWVSSKSFILPNKVVKISHTETKHGITTTDIIAVTSTGAVLRIPKFVLNSRRIADREFTASDAGDDYRLTPYEALVSNGNEKFYHVINHASQLQVDGKTTILVKPTNMESTSVVCVFGELDWFCTTVQPSQLFDMLPSSFAKIKLLLTIVVLLVGVLITKPMVDKQKLNFLWIDQ